VKLQALVLSFCLWSLGPAVSLGEEVATTPAALSAAAVKAYQQKDYIRFLANEKQALELQPSNPRFLYNVACGESLTGHSIEAIKLLNQLVDRKLDLGAETDDDFAGIRKTPEWSAFVSRLAELRKPIVRSEIAFKLSDPTLMAIGIAVDRQDGDTYIASIRERKIVRRTKTGHVSDFVREGQDGFLAGASLAIDGGRHLLFASSSAVPFMRGYREEEKGKSGLFVFDLKTGKLQRKAFLPVDGKLHFLNAVVVDHDGNAYVSDSGTPGIYRLGRNGTELEEFVGAGVFTSTQGLAFADDEKTMYVVDYSDGLWALDMASKKRRLVEGPPDVWLGGLDGLSRVGNGFITVQIGVRPERVLRLDLSGQGQRISAVTVLEMNHPEYDGPIQGAVDGQAFIYIANSQLRLGNGDTGAYAEEKARPTVVLRLPF